MHDSPGKGQYTSTMKDRLKRFSDCQYCRYMLLNAIFQTWQIGTSRRFRAGQEDATRHKVVQSHESRLSTLQSGGSECVIMSVGDFAKEMQRLYSFVLPL